VIDALEDLIEVARDGQNGYRDGAEHAKDPQLRRFLNSVSRARARFAGDLESYAVQLGKSDVDRSGSASGAIHRGWTDLKANLGGGDDTILSSMETATATPRNVTISTSKATNFPTMFLGSYATRRRRLSERSIAFAPCGGSEKRHERFYPWIAPVGLRLATRVICDHVESTACSSRLTLRP
jgi:uncharacterized protein (TIGR02284 family)